MAWWIPPSVPARNGEVPGHGRADRQHDGVMPAGGCRRRRSAAAPRPSPTD